MNIRAYIKGDETEIMALDARALPSKWNPRTLENWHWKFTDTNPCGHSLIRVAEHNGQMVAHFAAVPYALKVMDEQVKASHSIGALVENKYQNRGLLKLVGDQLMVDLVEQGIPYTWGFPNKRAYEFETKILGYDDLMKFDTWKLQKANIPDVSPDSCVYRINRFCEEFDRLWSDCSPAYPIAVVRTHQYLNWRFLQRPDWEYFCFGHYLNRELLGYIVLKLYREEEILRGHIIDLFGRKDDVETINRLIKHAYSFFREKAVDEITVWIHGSQVVEKLFLADGFDRIPSDIPLIMRVNIDHKYRVQVLNAGNWYFTMGDSTEIF